MQSLREWLEAAAPAMEAGGMTDSRLTHVRSRSYELACDWKVFCDNFLDGGYHVAVAHPDLAEGLDMGSYAHRIFERASVPTARTQATKSGGGERLGEPCCIGWASFGVLLGAVACVLTNTDGDVVAMGMACCMFQAPNAMHAL